MNTIYYVGYTKQEVEKNNSKNEAIIELLESNTDRQVLANTISRLYDKRILFRVCNLETTSGKKVNITNVVIFKNDKVDITEISEKLETGVVYRSSLLLLCEKCGLNLIEANDAIFNDDVNLLIDTNKKALLSLINESEEFEKAMNDYKSESTAA